MTFSALTFWVPSKTLIFIYLILLELLCCVFVSLHWFCMFDKAKSYNTAKIKKAWYLHMLDGIYYALQFHVFDFNLSWLFRKFMHSMMVKSVVKLTPIYINNFVYLHLYTVDGNRRRSLIKYWNTSTGRFGIWARRQPEWPQV